MESRDVIIVGAGNAGMTAVETLKNADPGLSILLANAESVFPYKRTQVSKKISTGYLPEDFAVKETDWYAATGIDLRTDARVTELDTAKRKITLETAGRIDSFSFGHLILATGGRPVIPRKVPQRGWSTIRGVADGLALRAAVGGIRRVAVAGMGVLGIEAAYQMSLMGKDVILFGSGARPMENVLDDETASLLRAALDNAGVDFRPGVRLEGARHNGNEIVTETDDGDIRSDHIVFCLGIAPEIDLARNAGLGCGRGILVDEALRTTAEGIYAAGDAAEHPGGRCTGIWHAAEHQGRLAASAILGTPVINDLPPYRLKCEVYGGYWFTAGPVTEPANGGTNPKLEAAESWEIDGILWRPRFSGGRLRALSGAAPEGITKERAKKAQNAVLEGFDRLQTRNALTV